MAEVEKRFVVDGMQLSYEGVFSIVEFYKKVEEWISSKGKEKDIKKRLEHVEPEGKKIEWDVEIWEDITEYARVIVRMRALFDGVEEVEIKRDKTKERLNKGRVLIVLDGILESETMGKWQQKPLYYFLRSLVDKFIHMFYTHRFDSRIVTDVDSLHTLLNDFFNSYK